jgi:tetratricopeptide (TPR) repeat protein
MLLWIRAHTRFLGQVAVLGLVWFAFTIAPDSSVVPLPDLMAEHRTYLPSVGVFLVAAGLLCAWPVGAKWTVVFGATALLSSTAATLERSGVWSSPERMWRDVCDKSPQKPRPWINLCAAYFEAGKLELAEQACLNSIKAQPTVPAFSNLAVLYRARNLPEKALQSAKEGLQLRPSGYDHLLLIQLGEVCCELRRWHEAISAFTEVLEMYPSLFQPRRMLGFCYLEIGNVDAALATFQVGLQHHPGNPELLASIARAQSNPPPMRLRLGR